MSSLRSAWGRASINAGTSLIREPNRAIRVVRRRMTSKGLSDGEAEDEGIVGEDVETMNDALGITYTLIVGLTERSIPDETIQAARERELATLKGELTAIKERLRNAPKKLKGLQIDETSNATQQIDGLLAEMQQQWRAAFELVDAAKNCVNNTFKSAEIDPIPALPLKEQSVGNTRKWFQNASQTFDSKIQDAKQKRQEESEAKDEEAQLYLDLAVAKKTKYLSLKQDAETQIERLTTSCDKRDDIIARYEALVDELMEVMAPGSTEGDLTAAVGAHERPAKEAEHV